MEIDNLDFSSKVTLESCNLIKTPLVTHKVTYLREAALSNRAAHDRLKLCGCGKSMARHVPTAVLMNEAVKPRWPYAS